MTKRKKRKKDKPDIKDERKQTINIRIDEDAVRNTIDMEKYPAGNDDTEANG